MKNIIREIRKNLNYSQVEFSEMLGVSFSAVNRWENGKSVPNQIAQMKIYEMAKEGNVDVVAMINKKLNLITQDMGLEEGRMLLYHGSKSGLKGRVAPVSRENCDFGKGFYMGTMPEQVLTLVCQYQEAKLYVVSVDMAELNILNVDTDFDWAMFVAYNRGKMEEAKGSTFYGKYESYAHDKDLVTGNIADDRMFFVIDNFFRGLITDAALVNSLSALKMGDQYVAITDKACDAVRIEKEIEISVLEKEALRDRANDNRKKGIELADSICRKARREGRFFDEIIEEALHDK